MSYEILVEEREPIDGWTVCTVCLNVERTAKVWRGKYRCPDERLHTASVELGPFPHYYLEEVFPEDYYRELLQRLPASDVYENLYEVTDLKLDHFRHRDQRDMNEGWTERLPPDLKPFWDSFNKWFFASSSTGGITTFACSTTG
jgi:hypothetical protein